MASNSHPVVEQLYLDDLYVGQRFTSGTYRMEEADMVRFAAEFDPQPFHLDRPNRACSGVSRPAGGTPPRSPCGCW